MEIINALLCFTFALLYFEKEHKKMNDVKNNTSVKKKRKKRKEKKEYDA